MFDLESGTFKILYHLCPVAKKSVSWHIFPANGREKSRKIKKMMQMSILSSGSAVLLLLHLDLYDLQNRCSNLLSKLNDCFNAIF